MSLLSRLATKLPELTTELAATEALGLLLADPTAADTVTAAIGAVAPTLPTSVRYATQQPDDEGRPDIVGSDGRREVVHIEGKYWAGLTPTQARGGYLDRMRRQHAEVATDEPHVGTLVFVVPPRRVATLVDELVGRYVLTGPRAIGPWLSAQTADGITVAVVSWEDLLHRLTGVADASVAEDARQLLDLVRQVDHRSFTPWTAEQRTDQDSPRRILRLAGTVATVHERLIASGAATTLGRRGTITKGGPLAYGKRMRLGGAVVTLRVSLELWAKHGHSPLWLSFHSGAAPAARRVFGGQLVESDGWIAVPVELPEGRLEHEVLEHLVAWLTDAGRRLEDALGGQAPPDGDDEDAPDNGDDDGDGAE